jgi:cytoskeletal protein RodZ
MNPRRNGKSQNGEMPLSADPADVPVPEGRIELGNAPEINITDDQVGLLFTERRRALGLRIEEIAEDIKVKPEYLRAIEREEFDQLPTPQYARLFVRAYGERLGFNTAEVYALIDINIPTLGAVTVAKPAPVPAAKESDLAGPLPGTQATYPDSPKKQSKTVILWWGIGLTVIILTIVGWIVLNWEQPAEDTSVAPAQPTPAETTTPAAVEDNVVPPEDEPPVVVADPSRFELVLRFDRDTWASLRADGEPVDNRIFTAGEVLTASAEDRFRLSLGHTVGVSASVGGKPLRPFLDWASQLEGHLITRDSVTAWIDTSSTAALVAGESVIGPVAEDRDSAGAP